MVGVSRRVAKLHCIHWWASPHDEKLSNQKKSPVLHPPIRRSSFAVLKQGTGKGKGQNAGTTESRVMAKWRAALAVLAAVLLCGANRPNLSPSSN